MMYIDKQFFLGLIVHVHFPIFHHKTFCLLHTSNLHWITQSGLKWARAKVEFNEKVELFVWEDLIFSSKCY